MIFFEIGFAMLENGTESSSRISSVVRCLVFKSIISGSRLVRSLVLFQSKQTIPFRGSRGCREAEVIGTGYLNRIRITPSLRAQRSNSLLVSPAAVRILREFRDHEIERIGWMWPSNIRAIPLVSKSYISV